jgi:hypothetical protein
MTMLASTSYKKNAEYEKKNRTMQRISKSLEYLYWIGKFIATWLD